MTAADEYQRVLDAHLPVFECDGDYGEMLWVECSCGSEYFLGTDAGYSEHRAHVAQALAADPGVRAAVEREAPPHCPTCSCGCTCGWGGQHDSYNPRCDLYRQEPSDD